MDFERFRRPSGPSSSPSVMAQTAFVLSRLLGHFSALILQCSVALPPMNQTVDTWLTPPYGKLPSSIVNLAETTLLKGGKSSSLDSDSVQKRDFLADLLVPAAQATGPASVLFQKIKSAFPLELRLRPGGLPAEDAQRAIFAVLIKHTGRTKQAIDLAAECEKSANFVHTLSTDSPLVSLYIKSQNIRYEATVVGTQGLNQLKVNDIHDLIERIRLRSQFLLSLQAAQIDIEPYHDEETDILPQPLQLQRTNSLSRTRNTVALVERLLSMKTKDENDPRDSPLDVIEKATRLFLLDPKIAVEQVSDLIDHQHRSAAVRLSALSTFSTLFQALSAKNSLHSMFSLELVRHFCLPIDTVPLAVAMFPLVSSRNNAGSSARTVPHILSNLGVAGDAIRQQLMESYYGIVHLLLSLQVIPVVETESCGYAWQLLLTQLLTKRILPEDIPYYRAMVKKIVHFFGPLLEFPLKPSFRWNLEGASFPWVVRLAAWQCVRALLYSACSLDARRKANKISQDATGIVEPLMQLVCDTLASCPVEIPSESHMELKSNLEWAVAPRSPNFIHLGTAEDAWFAHLLPLPTNPPVALAACILRARYGAVGGNPSEPRYVDVTSILKDMVKTQFKDGAADFKLVFPKDFNALFTDPVLAVVKKLEVVVRTPVSPNYRASTISDVCVMYEFAESDWNKAKIPLSAAGAELFQPTLRTAVVSQAEVDAFRAQALAAALRASSFPTTRRQLASPELFQLMANQSMKPGTSKTVKALFVLLVRALLPLIPPSSLALPPSSIFSASALSAESTTLGGEEFMRAMINSIGVASLDVLSSGSVENLALVQGFVAVLRSLLTKAADASSTALWRALIMTHIRGVDTLPQLFSDLCGPVWTQYLTFSPGEPSGSSQQSDSFMGYLAKEHSLLYLRLLSVVASLDILGAQMNVICEGASVCVQGDVESNKGVVLSFESKELPIIVGFADQQSEQASYPICQLEAIDHVSAKNLELSGEELHQFVRVLANCAQFSSVPPSKSTTYLALLLTALRVRCLRALTNLLQHPSAVSLLLDVDQGAIARGLALLASQADSGVATPLLEMSSLEQLSKLSKVELESAVQCDLSHGSNTSCLATVQNAGKSFTTTFQNFSGRMIKHFSSSTSHALACCDDGSLWAWGSNKYGQLGSGVAFSDDSPMLVLERAGIVFVCAGAQHSIAVSHEGQVYTFGANGSHQLGYRSQSGGKEASPRLARLPPGSFVVKAAAGDEHTLLLLSDGSLLGCGSNQSFELGSNTPISRFAVKLKFGHKYEAPKFIDIAALHDWSFAITQSGQLVHWGCGVSDPTNVQGIPKNERISQIALTKKKISALSQAGSVYFCELLAKPKPVNSAGPQPSLKFSVIAELKDVKKIGLGAQKECFWGVDSSNAVHSWTDSKAFSPVELPLKNFVISQLPSSFKYPLLLLSTTDHNTQKSAKCDEVGTLSLLPVHFFPLTARFQSQDVFGSLGKLHRAQFHSSALQQSCNTALLLSSPRGSFSTSFAAKASGTVTLRFRALQISEGLAVAIVGKHGAINLELSSSNTWSLNSAASYPGPQWISAAPERWCQLALSFTNSRVAFFVDEAEVLVAPRILNFSELDDTLSLSVTCAAQLADIAIFDDALDANQVSVS